MKNSIRSRLITIFVILAIGPLLLVGTLLAWQQYQREQQQALALQRELAQRVATQVSAAIEGLTNELHLMASLTEASILDNSQFERVLEQLLADNGSIYALYVLDGEGEEKIHISRVSVSQHGHKEWAATNEFLTPMVTGEVYYSPLRFEEDTAQPFLSINMPLYDVQTGRVNGVLIADMRVSDIWKLIADLEVGAGESVYIVDSANNQLIAHRNPSLVLRGTYFPVLEGGDGLREGLTGETALLASAPIMIGRQTWVVAAEKLFVEAMTPMVRTIGLTAVLFLFVFIMAMLYGYLTVQNIVKPIENLAGVARAIQAGDLSQRVESDGYAEIRDLARAFNSMADQLQQTLGGLKRNVVELQQAQSALQASEIKYRGLFENAHDIVYTHDLKGNFTSANRKVKDVLGYLEDEVLRLNIAQIVHPEDLPLAQENTRKKLTGQEMATTYELRALKKNGAVVILEVGTRLIYEDGAPVGVQGIARDVTGRKETEEALRQGQKLESIGLLAGGVAHDFNNLLTGMLAQTSLAIRKLSTDSPARKNIEKAVVSAERAADLTRQLLAYAGKGQFKVEPIKINVVIQENAELLETAVPKQAELILDLASDLPTIEADRGQIQQVVMNLVLNAVEALHDQRGSVELKSCLQEVDQTYIADGQFLVAGGLSVGQYVCLQVSDNGIGMDEATLARIFDPFFSTKTSGRGLGLSATLGIIRGHGGGLQVESNLGEGTMFTILFPAGESAVEEEPIAPVEERPLPADKVLVIDDEALVRGAVADILEMLGLETLMAENGREGVAVYEERQSEIALVWVDMQMPIMNGAETIAALQALNPDVKTILSSGRSEAELSALFEANPPTVFLQKPYDVGELIAEVKRLL